MTQDNPPKYVFGPVASRRLGRSLGIDVTPFKTCTYDCIYCQLGPTTCHTIERREYVPLVDVKSELMAKLAAGSAPDWITFAGSGEPTLYARLGELIAFIKDQTDLPVAVITNGSLLYRSDVQDDLLRADLVIPSLDAGTEQTFKEVKRPCCGLRFEQVVEGLAAFRQRSENELWLEVFLVGGPTTNDDELHALARHIERIGPDRIHLNTVVRSSGSERVGALPQDQMERYAQMLGPNAEVIADYQRVENRQAGQSAVDAEDVLALLRRHPCSLDDIAQGLGADPDRVRGLVQDLENTGRLVAEDRPGGRAYRAAK